jgi:DNA helicase HerA-like ATPase
MADDPDHVSGRLLVGKGGKDWQYLELPLGNRHGLVTGATGTGKTVTLQRLAEGFSRAGTSVFTADVKGDLAGISQPGADKPSFIARAKELGLTLRPEHFPVVFWDLFGEQGHPVCATVQSMGPILLSRLLDLNDTQEGVLNIVFRVAADRKLPLVTLDDLRDRLSDVVASASELATRYGNVATASVGAIQRQLLVIENQGGRDFFGAQYFEIADLLEKAPDGRGIIGVLAADRLMRSPRLYAMFLLWLLSELFEELPEVGDPDHPKLVFFFDEAHLLFDNAPKALMEAIEQIVRLVRSKGVGVYFVTQNPLDVPETVLGQLGNRAQHALRAFTPRDQKAVKAAAETFRQNPAFDTAAAITQLSVGEALVSMLDLKGAPGMVERTMIAPPASRVGPITADERKAVIEASPFFGKYEAPAAPAAVPAPASPAPDAGSSAEGPPPSPWGHAPGQSPLAQRRSPMPRSTVPQTQAPVEADAGGGLLDTIGGLFLRQPGSRRMSTGELVVRSAVQSAARSLGTQVVRAIVKGMTGGGGRGIADLGTQDLGTKSLGANIPADRAAPGSILDVKTPTNPLRPDK